MKQGTMIRKYSLAAVLAMFALVMGLVLTGCAGNNYGYTGGVAATVNGTDIEEDTVTKYIQDFRTSSDLNTDDNWAMWMIQASLDPETVRADVIDYYTEQVLIDQACEEYGITIEPDQIQAQIDMMKANYDSDDAWKAALEQAGITEEEYREAIDEGLKKQALQSKVAENAEVSDEDLLNTFNMYSSMFADSKRSQHILFNASDAALAQEVLDKINSGQMTFEEAAQQYSQDTGSAINGGDVGWDTLTTFVPEYQDALDSLDKGQTSGLVTSDYGIHIIRVTDTFNPKENTTNVADIPAEFVSYLRNILLSQSQATVYTEWYNNYKDQADIVINEMPANVPYNLDMSYYQTEEDPEAVENILEEQADQDPDLQRVEENSGE